MSVDYIRKSYMVPAKVGGRVRYFGGKEPAIGTIIGAEGAHLKIRLADTKRAQPFHPTWKIDYLDERGEVIWRSPS